jgi:hypothetical protein
MKWVLLFIILLPNGDKEVEQMNFETKALCEEAITRFAAYTESTEDVKKYGLQAPEKIKPIMCVQVAN